MSYAACHMAHSDYDVDMISVPIRSIRYWCIVICLPLLIDFIELLVVEFLDCGSNAAFTSVYHCLSQL